MPDLLTIYLNGSWGSDWNHHLSFFHLKGQVKE